MSVVGVEACKSVSDCDKRHAQPAPPIKEDARATRPHPATFPLNNRPAPQTTQTPAKTVIETKNVWLAFGARFTCVTTDAVAGEPSESLIHVTADSNRSVFIHFRQERTSGHSRAQVVQLNNTHHIPIECDHRARVDHAVNELKIATVYD